VYLFVLRGFYAQHDTRTPFFINLFENAINIVLAIVLVDRFDVLGLGIAFSVAYVVSAIIATVVLASNNKAIRLGGLAIDILRIIVAGVAMAIAVRFGSDMFISSDSSLTISVAGLAALTRVLVGITIGGVTYIAALALLGEPHLRNYWLTRTTKSSR
jgi:putative peptidoglycan lipid II flippase